MYSRPIPYMAIPYTSCTPTLPPIPYTLCLLLLTSLQVGQACLSEVFGMPLDWTQPLAALFHTCRCGLGDGCKNVCVGGGGAGVAWVLAA